MMWEERGSLLKLFKGGSVKIGISSEEPPACLQNPLVLSHMSLVLILVSTLIAFQSAPSETTCRTEMHMLPWEQTCVTVGI